MNIPMVVGEKFPLDAPHVERFPFNRAREFFDADMLSSTPAYMMALALIEGAENIGIWGVDMAVDDHEYFHQQPVMMAWIGYAMGRGVSITIPEESALHPRRHAYVEGRDYRHGEKAMVRGATGPFTSSEFFRMIGLHADEVGKARDQIAALEARVAMHEGARQAYERLSKVARAVESGQDIDGLAGSFAVRQ